MIYFFLSLGFLILIHEWGHFIMARLNGIFVEEFSIGFGPKLLAKKWGATLYKISLLPFGGFVKMRGEGEDETDEATRNAPDSFSAKPLWSRFSVILGGPTMNILFCLLAMPLVFLLDTNSPKIFTEAPVVTYVLPQSPASAAGITVGDQILEINKTPVATWKEFNQRVQRSPGQVLTLTVRHGQREQQMTIMPQSILDQAGQLIGIEPFLSLANDPIIGTVMANGAASQAKLQAGDRVTAVNGQAITVWTELVLGIQSATGKPLPLTVQRGAEKLTVILTPQYNDAAKRWVVGIQKTDQSASIPMITVTRSIAESFKLGMRESWDLTKLTFNILKQLFSGNLSYKALSGPLGIAKASAMVAERGFSDFLHFMAFLSLQLGILNLLPIPVLDGGHVVFLALEAIRGKPLSPKVRGAAQGVGMVLLLGLMLLVTVNDADSMWGIKQWFSKLF